MEAAPATLPKTETSYAKALAMRVSNELSHYDPNMSCPSIKVSTIMTSSSQAVKELRTDTEDTLPPYARVDKKCSIEKKRSIDRLSVKLIEVLRDLIDVVCEAVQNTVFAGRFNLNSIHIALQRGASGTYTLTAEIPSA